MDADGSVSNVVFITVDSLRADAIGPYDGTRHTPVMDTLADRGAVFERAFANGNWTPFSFPSILASRPVFADSGRIGVDEVETLPEVLSAEGLATGGFNAANGFLTEFWGYDDGFDEFEPFITNVGSSIYSRYLAKHPTVEAWLQLASSPIRRIHAWLNGTADDRPFLDTSRMFDVEHAATSFIDDADDPFFLWIHYMDTHTPYVPAPRYIREVSDGLLGTHRMIHAHTRTGLGWDVDERTLGELRTLYQAAVRQVDASVGRLLDALASNGIADETAVVLAGDHGEEFQEHGHLAHYPKLYDELTHVPLIVDVPGADSRRIEDGVGLDAIPPTVTDLLGASAAEAWTGESLLESVRRGTPPSGDPVVSVTVRGEEVTTQPIPREPADGDLLVSAREGPWTYIRNLEDGTAELYHRPSDPTQQADLTADPDVSHREVMNRLDSLIEAHATAIREPTDGKHGDQTAVDEDLETRLEALGYR